MRYWLFVILLLPFSEMCAQQNFASQDIYGGRTDVTCRTKLGTWHTEKSFNRWWICTPLNHGFWKESVYVTDKNFGLGGGINVTTKYGNLTNYANAELARLNAWSFNAIDLTADATWYPTASPTPTILLPFIGKEFASDNADIMNIWDAQPSGFYVTSPYLPFQPDITDPQVNANLLSRLQSSSRGWPQIIASSNNKYLMQMSIDDADHMWGFHVDTCTPNPVYHLAWVALSASPVKTVSTSQPYNTTNDQTIFYSPQLLAKAGLESFLKTRYGSIGSLNTAWGSTYTTFDSSGTCPGYSSSTINCAGGNPSAETLATGDGRTTAYSYTLAHLTPSRYSVGILVGGTIVAGNLAHDSGSGNAAPTNTTDGRIWGPYLTGTITYGTGVLSVTFSTTRNTTQGGSAAISSISIASNVVTVISLSPHGLWTGAKVNISGTANYNGTALGPITVIDRYTFTYLLTGSFATETTGTYALNAVPGASDTISVMYVYNGWEIGTGLLDEANNHAWSNGDAYSCNLSMLSTQMQTDLNDYLGGIPGVSMANVYYTNVKNAIGTVFGASNLFPMYGGVDGMDGVAKAPILKAAGQVLDVLITNYDGQLTQSQLDTLEASYGDRPLYDSFYPTSTLDSPSSRTPDGILAASPIGVLTFFTKESEAQIYAGRVRSALDSKYTATGSYPYVGIGRWSYFDMNDLGGTNRRFGLVDWNDNAYDGHEDTTGSVTCSAPLQAYTCGSDIYVTPTWQSTTGLSNSGATHVVGQVSGVYYIFTGQGGTTGSSEPNWTMNCPNSGNTCSDASVTWTNQGIWTKAAAPTPMGNLINKTALANELWLQILVSGRQPRL